jgi:DNA repair exonuclease SbcCD ATPase subunit
MQQNQQHDLQIIKNSVQKIEQGTSLIQFDTIQLPFELVEAGMNLWESTFHPEVLRQLANGDADTLDAWAIALSQTLNTQLEILNSWLPHLTTLPIPTTLQQKIRDRTQTLNKIATEKSNLLQTSAELLNKEQQLNQDKSNLQTLKEKARQLQEIQAELQATNLENLRQSIATQGAEIEPQREILNSLKQQKADLDDQIEALQRQQTTLKEEITYWQSRQNRLENSISDSVSQLITLTQVQREVLSEALSKELAALEQQRAELIKQQESYHQAQQQLQKCREDFQKYQTATEEIRTAVTTHYHSNHALGTLLPVDRQKVDSLLKNIEQYLAEIDQELATARSKHEQAQQKNRILF